MGLFTFLKRKIDLVLDKGVYNEGDIIRMAPVTNCEFIKADLFGDSLTVMLPEADVVLSDAATSTAGDSRD